MFHRILRSVEARYLAFALLCLGFFLGARGLNEPDEGRYAELGREMAAGGDWLVPHLNGIEHFQKPPWLYWCTAASIRLLGANEWAARLPSALAALGVLLLTWSLARRLLDPARALTAALILLSSVEFFALARLLSPDMMLTFWVTAAIAALVHRRRWLFFACMGVGFLTKGPMALVVPICAAIGWQVTSKKEAAHYAPLPWVRGLLLSLGLGLSWFIALSFHRPELFDYFWRYELLQRFASHAHGRSKPFWFFAPVLLIGFIPWTAALPQMLRAAWGRLRARDLSPAHALLLGWALPPLIVLSLSGSKLLTYVLPLFPALAIAASVVLARITWTRRVAIGATVVWALAAALVPIFDNQLGAQAPVDRLVAQLAAQPDFSQAQIFACEVRAHGTEFYSRRLVSVTREQADVVLPTSAEQSARLLPSAEACEAHFAQVPHAYGITRSERFAHTFSNKCWRVVAQQGDFVLIRHDSAAVPVAAQR